MSLNRNPKKQSDILKRASRLFFLLFLTGSIGYIGGTFNTPEAMKWYQSLVLSSLNPPAIWFGIVWGILYVCMSFSAWIVWGKTSPRPFVIQLALNLIWPFLFFHLRNPILSLVDTGIMIGFIALTIWQFGKISKISGGLMVPVLLWSLFALYLNTIVVLYNTQIGVWLGLI